MVLVIFFVECFAW